MSLYNKQIAAPKIASAILRLVGEHGLPNRFRASEIAEQSGLSNLKVGLCLSRELGAVNAILAGSGCTVTAYAEQPTGKYADVE